MNAQPFQQASDEAVIIPPNLVTAVPFRPEIARDTYLIRMVEHNARLIVRHPLRNHNMGVQPLLLLAVKVDKAAHGI